MLSHSLSALSASGKIPAMAIMAMSSRLISASIVEEYSWSCGVGDFSTASSKDKISLSR